MHPSVVGGCYCRRLIEAANCNIDLVCVWPAHERQLRAAMRTERTQPLCPSQLSRQTCGEPKAAPTERCPRHEWRATAPATIRTMAVGDVVRVPGRLISDQAAQTSAADKVWVYGYKTLTPPNEIG